MTTKNKTKKDSLNISFKGKGRMEVDEEITLSGIIRIYLLKRARKWKQIKRSSTQHKTNLIRPMGNYQCRNMIIRS
jgi:hypothetical protein